MALADSHRLVGFAISESWRGLKRRLGGRRAGAMLGGRPLPERLVLVPPDLHTADPTVAQEIYAGIFNLAGRSVSTNSESPFSLAPPTVEWARELNSFTWLRHLGAAGDAVSASNAQALVKDWISNHRHPSKDIAWDVEVAANRLVSWLCHSVILVRGIEIDDYQRFMRSIGQHIRFLRGLSGSAPDGMPRLLQHVALAYASVCVEGRKLAISGALSDLAEELGRQVLPDGCHISRNPGVLPELLALLLPLRESILHAGGPPPRELLSSIDRCAAAVRFFRMGDGSLARFNGNGATPYDLVATVLCYDQGMGDPQTGAIHGGFDRLSMNDTVILVDTGPTPLGDLSVKMHAGCLAFEMCSGEAPVIVNCGVPQFFNEAAMRAGRATAAHSTLVINDTSSCRFNADSVLGRYFSERIISGPARMTRDRQDSSLAQAVTASHDGYMSRFGVRHERKLVLGKAGSVLMGTDCLKSPGGRPLRKAANLSVAIRFHLHPSVSASKLNDKRTVRLSCARGQVWHFMCIDAEPLLEESVFFAVPGGSRRTSQIVLHAPLTKAQEIRWMLERNGD